MVTIASLSYRPARAQEQEPQPHLTPGELQIYRNARTLIDWTPDEIRAHPELKQLQKAQSQADLPAILTAVGQGVVTFLQNFRNIMCTEKVQGQVCRTMSALSVPSGYSEDSFYKKTGCTGFFDRKFRYLMIPHTQVGGILLDEYRTDAKGNTIDYKNRKDAPILTYGFAAASLYFHPRNQEGCRFRHFGRQILNGRQTDVVGFAQIPALDAPVIALRIVNVTSILEQGLAWIDASSHEIIRMQTDLLAPRPDIRLEQQTIQVDFSAIHLPDSPETFRLPKRVVVNAKYAGRHFQNTHEYSDFKLFRVESRIGAIPTN